MVRSPRELSTHRVIGNPNSPTRGTYSLLLRFTPDRCRIRTGTNKVTIDARPGTPDMF